MSPPETPHEETLFSTALALPEAARAAYLDQACAGNASLKSSVEALLRAHSAAVNFLPAVTGGGERTAEIAEQPGDWIGRYRLLQKIGEGGCGIVYMAEQEEPVRRRVALKVIKLGMDTKAVIARFTAERQALAMMDHPNIAKVLDAGATDSGRPFFVMELVRGIPITKYCDENGLATPARLELFIRTCHAVQHAHQKGVIHRDLKPSNILITLHDGAPVPKVIDFGIAKATQGRLTDQTCFTAFDQFIGTPAYMSPEQAEMSGLDIDTRSDIYSLGVLLYELLAGRPPFDPGTFLSAGVDEIRRLIREVDPPKPSTRLATLAEADRTTVAKLRNTLPAQLATALAGDLDWIVLRCLEKDRTRRYATPSELAADLQRHLHNEPVIARPPSTGYLLRKLIRRHQLAFAAGAAVTLTLVAGLVVSTVLLAQERAARERAVLAEATAARQRQEARNEAAKSAEVARFVTDMLKRVKPSVALGQDTKLLREILDDTAKRLATELLNQPEVAAELRETLGGAYLELGRHEMAERMLRAAVEYRRGFSGNQSEKTAASLHDWGRALRGLNQPADAEKALQEAFEIRRKLFGEEDPRVADTLAQLAWVIRPPNAAKRHRMLERVLALRQKAYGDRHPSIADALFELGNSAQAELDHAKGAELHDAALAMRRALFEREDHPEIAASLDKLGFSYGHELDRIKDAAAAYRESLRIRRKVLDDGHPMTVVSLLRFTGQQHARDVAPETVDYVREFVASQRRLLAPDSPLLGLSQLALASLEDQPGRNPEKARELTREAQRILDASLAGGTTLHPDVIEAMWLFGWFKFVGNAPAEGLAMGEAALKQTRASGARLFFPAHTLAWICVGLGRYDEAVARFEEAGLRRIGPTTPITLVGVAALGAVYRLTNRVTDSRELLAAALANCEKNAGKDDLPPATALVRCQHGLTLLREGRFAEAEAALRKAIVEYDSPGLKPLNLRLHPRAVAESGLGQALAGQGKFSEAEPRLLGALQELQANAPRLAGNPSALVREAHDAVIALYTAWGKPEQASEWKARLGEPGAAPR